MTGLITLERFCQLSGDDQAEYQRRVAHDDWIAAHHDPTLSQATKDWYWHRYEKLLPAVERS